MPGISSVKAVPNGKTSLNDNLHDVYINGSGNVFKPVKNKLLGVETSRKFDIEMKTVYYVVATVESGETVYTVQKTEIPMLFVQKKNVDDFSKDIVKENTFSTTPTLPTAKLEVAKSNFSALSDALSEVKESVTYEELVEDLGTKNSFFQ